MKTNENTRWFADCRTIEKARKTWKDLMVLHHPDHGGNVETAQTTNAQFDEYLTGAIDEGFDAYAEAKGQRPAWNIGPFADALHAACRLNCRVEVIGYWVYAFDSFAIRETLKSGGFWFSAKHKAWVFSGGKKRSIRSRYSTDDVRTMHGSTVYHEQKDAQRVNA